MFRSFHRRFIKHGLLICTSAIGTGYLGQYIVQVILNILKVFIPISLKNLLKYFFQKNKLNAASPALHTPEIWLDDFPSRETQIDKMSKEPEYDVVVIGGGATGCGVAVDAASRGMYY